VLDGGFSLAYWDESKGVAILAVDRAGYERLYYTQVSGAWVFASDYKALLAISEVRIAPDPDALQSAIATMKVNLDTPLASGIQRVRQAHAVVVRGQSVESGTYWRAKAAPTRTDRPKAASELRELLEDQVRRFIAPYEKPGLTLSGGLDSSGVLAVVRHVFPDKSLSTYSIGTSTDDPELAGARESAAHFGTAHSEAIFSPASIVEDLPRLVWLAEELAGREQTILQYQIELQLLGKEEVVIAGHGADMVFAGMPRHRLIRMMEKIPLAKRPLTELFQQTQSGQVPKSLRGKAASWLLYRGRNIEPPRLAGSSASTRAFEPVSLDSMLEHSSCEMPELFAHSATHSLAPLEVFNPFLGNEIVDFASTLPAQMKTSLTRQKIVLREALAPLLPDAIRKRGKAIQRARHDIELTQVLEEMAEVYLNSAAVASRGLVSEKYVASIRNKPASQPYSGDRLSRLWMLLVCEIWCRVFIDNRGKPLEQSDQVALKVRGEN
jgi:asparagine synthase (glutamine-hydrolysing)